MPAAVVSRPPTRDGPGTSSRPKSRSKPWVPNPPGVRVLGLKPKEAEPSIEEHKVENLKQQVHLLECDNQSLRTGGAAVGGSAGDTRLDAATCRLHTEYYAGEAAVHTRERELEGKAEKLRREAPSAKLREARAIDEMSESRNHLAEQRERFASSRQELTAEVVAYQRDLDKYYQLERSLRADLDDMTRRLRDREAFVEGFDTQVRLLQTQLGEKTASLARAAEREGLLKVELQEESVAHAALKDKYRVHEQHIAQMDELRERASAEARTSQAELRLCQMSLEQEAAARKLSDEAKAFLVGESAQLEGAVKELTASAELVSRENARLGRDIESSKVLKVLGRFMIRKMREKLRDSQQSHARLAEGQEALHMKLVKAQQRSDAIERELALQRRRHAMREEAFDQTQRDASNLSVENRLLLERAEQLVTDLTRYSARNTQLEEQHVQLASDAAMLRERADLAKELRSFKPDELKHLQDSNLQMADRIKALLPRLSMAGLIPESGTAPGVAAPSTSSKARTALA